MRIGMVHDQSLPRQQQVGQTSMPRQAPLAQEGNSPGQQDQEEKNDRSRQDDAKNHLPWGNATPRGSFDARQGRRCGSGHRSQGNRGRQTRFVMIIAVHEPAAIQPRPGDCRVGPKLPGENRCLGTGRALAFAAPFSARSLSSIGQSAALSRRRLRVRAP